MIIGKMADGESKAGKQVLFILTVTSLTFMVLYYYGQNKLTKIKIDQLKKANTELQLSSLSDL